jgi:tetratricopeptide (TPR) repeat protein
LLDRLPESGQPQRALTLVQSAIEACGASGVAPARMLDLYETGIDAANRLGRRQEERDMLDRMIELPLDLERSPALAARVYLAHGRHALGTGDLGLARGWFANAAQLARNAGSDALACDALRRLAVVHGLTGDLAKALELAREALAIAPDARRRAFAWLVVAQADVLENRIESALDALASARHELAGLDEASIWGALGALDMLTARVFRSAGRQGRALAAAGRAVRRARRAGDRRLEVEASARLGGLLIDLDRLDDAEAHLRDATTLAREIEDRGGEALAGLWLSVLLWERDDERAADQVARTVATAGELGLFRLRALALALQARQFHAAGDLRRASDTSATAQDLLARYGAELVDGIVISGTRALVLHAAGRRGEARALVRRLRRTMRDENRAVARPELRGAQRRYTTRLLEAVLSPDGPLYPRSPVGD